MAAGHNQRPRGELMSLRRIQQRQVHEAKPVAGDSQKKQERDHRVRAEDDPGDEVDDREIDGQGHRPAGGQHRFVQQVDDAQP